MVYLNFNHPRHKTLGQVDLKMEYPFLSTGESAFSYITWTIYPSLVISPLYAHHMLAATYHTLVYIPYCPLFSTIVGPIPPFSLRLNAHYTSNKNVNGTSYYFIPFHHYIPMILQNICDAHNGFIMPIIPQYWDIWDIHIIHVLSHYIPFYLHDILIISSSYSIIFHCTSHCIPMIFKFWWNCVWHIRMRFQSYWMFISPSTWYTVFQWHTNDILMTSSWNFTPLISQWYS